MKQMISDLKIDLQIKNHSWLAFMRDMLFMSDHFKF